MLETHARQRSEAKFDATILRQRVCLLYLRNNFDYLLKCVETRERLYFAKEYYI